MAPLGDLVAPVGDLVAPVGDLVAPVGDLVAQGTPAAIASATRAFRVIEVARVRGPARVIAAARAPLAARAATTVRARAPAAPGARRAWDPAGGHAAVGDVTRRGGRRR